MLTFRKPLSAGYKYQFRWGTGQWQSNMIEPYGTYRHWWAYTDNSRSSPIFQIQFDTDFGTYDYYRTYDLVRYRSYSTDCDGAKKYYFGWTTGSNYFFDLFERP